MKKIKAYPETHQEGLVEVENLDIIFFNFHQTPYFLENADVGVKVSEDGRVWICINGVAFLRFKPIEKKEQPMCHNYLG
jgi:hypothetical protein